MNNNRYHCNDSPSVNADVPQIHADLFMAELRAAGYAAKTLCTKRTALEQFLRWRHRCKSHPRDMTEAEIEAFLAKALKGDRSDRSVASRALYGFLDYLLERTRDRSSQCARLLATSLRSFLRFLHAQGEIPSDLAAAIPTVRRWTQPGIPRTLTRAEVDQILDIPDLKTATGRRDHAILLLLARLGLRSSEVLSLELGDLRWRAGEIMIRGKGSRQDLLPLPRDVGAAIARYLQSDRGVSPTRRVFLRTIAPRVPLTGPASIGHIVRRAMTKAKVQRPRQVAAHLFRHTLASRMLHRGAHLREISQVLRHRTLSSTEIYAKIDHGMLREVVRPWPTNGGAR